MAALSADDRDGAMMVPRDEPMLETARLILRPTQADDFDGWAAMMANPEGTEFIGGVQSRPVAWRGFLSMAGAWSIQGFAMFSVIEKETGRWVGRVGPWVPDGWPGPEIGWAIMPDCWGRGYAVESAAAAIDWVFDHLGWTEVIHTIHPRNTASQAVARKLGAEVRGSTLLPEPVNPPEADVWHQTREEWRARRRIAEGILL